ncbi:MAG: glycosyltransferase [Syntrophobacteraceae bacterium]
MNPEASRPILSVCMIVRDEEKNLPDCLSAVRTFADEIVVVDTGSGDRTKEVALNYTPNVFGFKWIDDFSAARNRSLALARGRYAMWLDADDRFPAESIPRMHELKGQMYGEKAFYFTMENIHGDRPPTQWLQLRCVPLREDIRFEGRIHEQLFPSVQRLGLPLIALDILIQHEGYADQGACVGKMRRNLRILEEELHGGRNDPELHFFLARTYLGLGQEQEAVEAFTRTIQGMERTGSTAPPIVECSLQLASLLESRGEKPAAQRVFLKAAALAGDCTQHLYQLALLAQSLEMHVEAANLIRRLKDTKHLPYLYPSEKVPPREELCVLAAYSYLCLNRRAQAAEQLGEAWRCGLDAGRSWEMMGVKAARAGREDLALACLEASERGGGMSPEGYCALGEVRLKRGLTDGAAQCFQAALSLAPDNGDALRRLGRLRLQQGDLPEARRLLRPVADNGEGGVDVLLELALIASTEQDMDEFDRLQEQILKCSQPDGANSGDPHGTAGKASAPPRPRMAEMALKMKSKNRAAGGGKPR